jgi:hypothetical protein
MPRYSLPLAIVPLGLPGSRVARGQEAASADALFAKGMERRQAGDILGALEAYPEALSKQPSRVDARSKKAHQSRLLPTVYHQQKKKLRDKEKKIAEELQAKRQAREPGSRDELGNAYKGESATPDAPPSSPETKPGSSPLASPR